MTMYSMSRTYVTVNKDFVVVRVFKLQGWLAKVCVTAVSLPDLESHVSAMNVDAFALRCVRCNRLVVVTANVLQVVLQALKAV